MKTSRNPKLECAHGWVLLLSCTAKAWILPGPQQHLARTSLDSWPSTAEPSPTIIPQNDLVTVDESGARSMFGTKAYWDDVYAGRGDFPADCYSWYYDWGVLGKQVKQFVPSKTQKILVPGVGNDSLLVDLVQAGYRNLVGQDYSEHALERQRDLLFSVEGASGVTMVQGDVTRLPYEWTSTFDVIIEKGLLDAVYLSGDGNVELAIAELFRILRPGGLFLSVSGVVPEDLRRQLACEMEWLRDGTNDLQAGFFVWRKRGDCMTSSFH